MLHVVGDSMYIYSCILFIPAKVINFQTFLNRAMSIAVCHNIVMTWKHKVVHPVLVQPTRTITMTKDIVFRLHVITTRIYSRVVRTIQIVLVVIWANTNLASIPQAIRPLQKANEQSVLLRNVNSQNDTQACVLQEINTKNVLGHLSKKHCTGKEKPLSTEQQRSFTKRSARFRQNNGPTVRCKTSTDSPKNTKCSC